MAVPRGDRDENDGQTRREDERGERASIEQQQRREAEGREQQEVRPRECREAERQPGREPCGERPPERQREHRCREEDRQTRLVHLGDVEDIRLVEREGERGEQPDHRPGDASSDDRDERARARGERHLEEPDEQQVASPHAVGDRQEVRIQRVHVERPVAEPVAGGDATCPLVVVVRVDDEVIEPRRGTQGEDVSGPERRGERHGYDHPPPTVEETVAQPGQCTGESPRAGNHTTFLPLTRSAGRLNRLSR